MEPTKIGNIQLFLIMVYASLIRPFRTGSAMSDKSDQAWVDTEADRNNSQDITSLAKTSNISKPGDQNLPFLLQGMKFILDHAAQ